MLEFLNQNLNYLLLAIIIVGGLFVTKYTKEIKIKDTYKVLIASVVFSAIFYAIDGCGQKCLNGYLFTYLFATSLYELILKYFLQKLNQLK
ncbi:hypothetical protein BWK62_13385 [Flavobacterium oreochromis]|uniref:Uncharacterized protein n=1 Tax=Flavobacterium columnare TaxID=996 RepID=A0A246G7Y1_9FLAO|nr:hypothetical protein BWK62_13385 [Flavobacterium oreochromis]